MKPGVTQRNLDVLEAMSSYRKAVGLWPTMKEVGDRLGISKVSVYFHLKALEKHGLVQQSKKNCSRSWSVNAAACERASAPLYVSPFDNPGSGSLGGRRNTQV